MGNAQLGDFDIYKSYRLKNNWSEPQNIGPLVNGAGSEYYFTIDSKVMIYFMRVPLRRTSKFRFIFFPVPMEAHPEALAN